jgi:hypothetical protein
VKTIQWTLIALTCLTSVSALADTMNPSRGSDVTLKAETDLNGTAYPMTSTNKKSDDANGLTLKNGSSSVQLYGTIDVGYEHWSGSGDFKK